MSQALDQIEASTIIGPYRIVRGFKKGGMARVFEVEVRKKYQQPHMPKRLALKIAKEEFQAALVAESDFLKRFDHPNVVRIFPLAGYHRPVYAARERLPFGWGWYYAMEMIRGKSLDDYLTRRTTITNLLNPPSVSYRLSVQQTVGIARQLLVGLAHIHEQRVINLDVKPGNVLFRHRRWQRLRGGVPEALLCDFGIARDIHYPRAGLLGVATPAYVSPEQALEKYKGQRSVDARSDIFSLGVMLYEMLTGQLPFEDYESVVDPYYAPTPPQQLYPSIPSPVADIILRALAKDPDARFGAANDMLSALDTVRIPFDWKKATRRTFAGLALAACLVGGGVGVKGLLENVPSTSTVKPTMPPTARAPVPSATNRSTSTLAPTHIPAASPTAFFIGPTSTLRPTATRTPTPQWPTWTPTPNPGG